jgi:hypothetical protein
MPSLELDSFHLAYLLLTLDCKRVNDTIESTNTGINGPELRRPALGWVRRVVRRMNVSRVGCWEYGATSEDTTHILG